MKTKIFILALLLSIGLVGAVEEGQIITQEQLDMVNFKLVDIQCQFEPAPQYEFIDGEAYYKKELSCLTVEKNGTDYVVVRNREGRAKFNVLDYLYCVLSRGAPYCNGYYNNFLQDQINRFDHINRARIWYFQSTDGGFPFVENLQI